MTLLDGAIVALFIATCLFVGLHPMCRAVLREMPSLYAERMDRWLLRQHGPFDLTGDGSGPAICLLCKKAWPCAEFIATDRRIDHRINSGETKGAA